MLAGFIVRWIQRKLLQSDSEALKKLKSATTSLYLIAICFNVALILFDFLVPFGIKIVIGEMSGNVFFAKFLCRTFLFLCYFWIIELNKQKMFVVLCIIYNYKYIIEILMIRRGKTMNKKEFLKKYNNYSHGYVIEVFKDDKDIEFVFGDRIVIPKREKTTSDTLYDIASGVFATIMLSSPLITIVCSGYVLKTTEL